jgi:hypothetical protein
LQVVFIAISKPEPAILWGGLLRLWETPAKVGLWLAVFKC